MARAKHLSWAFAAFMLCFASSGAFALDYVKPLPLTQVIKDRVQDCHLGETVPVPTIAWGADMATSLANGNAVETAPGSIFANEGLKIKLYRQDNFVQQVRDFLSCKTPYLRGTLGMINMAIEVLVRDQRTVPDAIHQLSWSAGGDHLVVKPGINSIKDLKSRIAVLNGPAGPHTDYAPRLLTDAILTVNDVTFKYVPDMLMDTPTSLSPAEAFRKDPNVAAAFVITPEAVELTSGKGENSFPGAIDLMDTRLADRVIPDVYVVRADYLEAHRDKVQAFTHGYLLAEERLQVIMREKGKEYKPTVSAAADLLLDRPTALDDMAGMYADAKMAGYQMNVKFFGDPNEPRNFDRLNDEIQVSFIQMGFISRKVPLTHAKWDYAVLAKGLNDTSGVEPPRFNPTAVAQMLEGRYQRGITEEGVKFEFSILFGPKETDFPPKNYWPQFDRMIDLLTTYSGAVPSMEGYADPQDYLKCKRASQEPAYRDQLEKDLLKKGDSIVRMCQSDHPGTREISILRQSLKNTSQDRAEMARKRFVEYAASKGIHIDPNQIGIVGYGITQPNTPKCTHDVTGDINLDCYPANLQEWNAARRVDFKIIGVSAESDVYSPM